MKFLLSLVLTTILFLGAIIEAHSCALPDSSIVYFNLFSTQTYLPVPKKDFQGGRMGGKMVIKNAYFKKLLQNASAHTNEYFIENIRMTVNFNKQIYYISSSGEIELNNSVIGELDKETRDHLDLGYDLYEWKTCRPMNEVLANMLKKHKKL